MKLIDVKEKDVFHACWKDTTKSNHCFEGLLIATKTNDGQIILVDTFWSSGDSKSFTIKQAEEDLNLSYYCNLNDYDTSINVKTAQFYYEKDDFIYMHDQHACVESCRYYYLKKGAVKSSAKMIASLNDKIEKQKREIESAKRIIEWAEADIEKITKGEIDQVWI